MQFSDKNFSITADDQQITLINKKTQRLHRHLKSSLWVFLSVVVLGTIFDLYFFNKSFVITCERTQPDSVATCQAEETFFLKSNQPVFSPTTTKDIEIKTLRDTDGETTCQVVLTNPPNQEFSAGFATSYNYCWLERDILPIRGLVNGMSDQVPIIGKQRFEYGFTTFLVKTIFFAVGLMTLFLMWWISLILKAMDAGQMVIDRQQRCVIITNPIFKSMTKIIPFNNIQGVEARQIGYTKKHSKTKDYQLMIYEQNRCHNFLEITDKKAVETVARQLNKWLVAPANNI